jgi:hypothetical protein
MGASLCFLPLVGKDRRRDAFLCTTYCRTLQAKNVSEPSLHRITAERRALYSVRVHTALRFSSSWLTQWIISVHLAAHALPHVCDMHLVYDVSNRESFEALPRWLEELENHVPPEVVKIVVGNKLDKVKSSPLLSSPSSFPADR